uniref:PGR5-like protein 1A, chloroplastic n=1 Tax=Ananas comosus var. bracteatus TaxID=296719 RepID=A0A6V7NKP2_ANACO|nr:unnamed protein product [Ananas comosus var. bracteatus]
MSLLFEAASSSSSSSSPRDCSKRGLSHQLRSRLISRKLLLLLSTPLLSLLFLLLLLWLILRPSAPEFSLRDAALLLPRRLLHRPPPILSPPPPSPPSSPPRTPTPTSAPSTTACACAPPAPGSPPPPRPPSPASTRNPGASAPGPQRSAGLLIEIRLQGRLRWKVGMWVSRGYGFEVACLAVVEVGPAAGSSVPLSQCSTTISPHGLGGVLALVLPPSPLQARSSLPSPSPSTSASAAASRVCSPPIRILRRRHARKALVRRPRAADQPGQVQDDEVVDSKILPYCSIDKKKEKTVGELEQEFLQALQAFYYDKKAIMSNEEFDNLKEELMWEGSSVVMLSPDEQKLLEASMAYVAGKPILTDAEFDELKMRLKKEGSDIVQEGPRCSLRSRKVYSDLSVDYFKMFLLNVPAAVVALGLFFFLDDLTGFEITYLLETGEWKMAGDVETPSYLVGLAGVTNAHLPVSLKLFSDCLTLDVRFIILLVCQLPEPFSFIFTWFAALPLIFWLAQTITSAILKDFLILKGPCPNCGTENLSFFGTILSVSSGGSTNTVKCSNCGTELVYDSKTRLITLPEPSEA